MSYEINDALNIKLNTALNTSVLKNWMWVNAKCCTESLASIVALNECIYKLTFIIKIHDPETT